MVERDLPSDPCEVVGSDLFTFDNDLNVVFIVYYSRWIEAVKVDSQTPEAVIKACWKVFSRFGIPRELRTDNGGGYASKEFRKFAETNGMRLITSSPRYP